MPPKALGVTRGGKLASGSRRASKCRAKKAETRWDVAIKLIADYIWRNGRLHREKFRTQERDRIWMAAAELLPHYFCYAFNGEESDTHYARRREDVARKISPVAMQFIEKLLRECIPKKSTFKQLMDLTGQEFDCTLFVNGYEGASFDVKTIYKGYFFLWPFYYSWISTPLVENSHAAHQYKKARECFQEGLAFKAGTTFFRGGKGFALANTIDWDKFSLVGAAFHWGPCASGSDAHADSGDAHAIKASHVCKPSHVEMEGADLLLKAGPEKIMLDRDLLAVDEGGPARIASDWKTRPDYVPKEDLKPYECDSREKMQQLRKRTKQDMLKDKEWNVVYEAMSQEAALPGRLPNSAA